MAQMTFLELTHANLKRKVFLVPSQVYYVYFSEADKCTHVGSHSGTVFPVTEPVEIVKRELMKALGKELKDE